jgi:hypothetical protein
MQRRVGSALTCFGGRVMMVRVFGEGTVEGDQLHVSSVPPPFPSIPPSTPSLLFHVEHPPTPSPIYCVPVPHPKSTMLRCVFSWESQTFLHAQVRTSAVNFCLNRCKQPEVTRGADAELAAMGMGPHPDVTLPRVYGGSCANACKQI